MNDSETESEEENGFEPHLYAVRKAVGNTVGCLGLASLLQSTALGQTGFIDALDADCLLLQEVILDELDDNQNEKRTQNRATLREELRKLKSTFLVEMLKVESTALDYLQFLAGSNFADEELLFNDNRMSASDFLPQSVDGLVLSRFAKMAKLQLKVEGRVSQQRLAVQIDQRLRSSTRNGASDALFLSHGLRLPLRSNGQFGLDIEGIVLDKDYRIDPKAMNGSTSLLSGARGLVLSKNGQSVYALATPIKPWLQVLYPYVPGRVSENLQLSVPHLEKHIQDQWSGFRCAVNEIPLEIHDAHLFFDDLMSRAYYVVDTSTGVRCASKQHVQNFLDIASHLILFVPDTMDAAEVASLKNEAMTGFRERGMVTLSGLWKPITYTSGKKPFNVGSNLLSVSVGGVRPAEAKDTVHFFNLETI